MERERQDRGAAEHRAYDETIADSAKFGSPAVFGGEEIAAQGVTPDARDWGASRETAYGEIPTGPADPSASDWPQTHPPSPPTASFPQPPPPRSFPPQTSSPPPPPSAVRAQSVVERRSIELTELVRFRDKLLHTMDALIEEYDQLLSPQDGTRRQSDS
jgi:hypothetical protein